MSDDLTEEQAVWEEHRRQRNEMTARRYTKLVHDLPRTTTIDIYPQIKIDEYGTVTIGEWGGYLIQIMPMIFNDRIVMTPISCSMVYDHGWCFDKGMAALLALLTWDPETMAEPAGYKKRATPGKRQPGDRSESGEIPIGVQTVYARWAGMLMDSTEQ